MTEEKAQAEERLRVAQENRASIKREMAVAITAEQKKIEAKYKPLLDKAGHEVSQSQSELDRINMILASADPRIGRKVWQRPASRTWRHTDHTPELFGIIEAYKPGNGYSGTRPPQPGEIIIRILKKDGSVSLRHKDMWRMKGELPDGWEWMEDATEQKES